MSNALRDRAESPVPERLFVSARGRRRDGAAVIRASYSGQSAFGVWD